MIPILILLQNSRASDLNSNIGFKLNQRQSRDCFSIIRHKFKNWLFCNIETSFGDGKQCYHFTEHRLNLNRFFGIFFWWKNSDQMDDNLETASKFFQKFHIQSNQWIFCGFDSIKLAQFGVQKCAWSKIQLKWLPLKYCDTDDKNVKCPILFKSYSLIGLRFVRTPIKLFSIFFLDSIAISAIEIISSFQFIHFFVLDIICLFMIIIWHVCVRLNRARSFISFRHLKKTKIIYIKVAHQAINIPFIIQFPKLYATICIQFVRYQFFVTLYTYCPE